MKSAHAPAPHADKPLSPWRRRFEGLAPAFGLYQMVTYIIAAVTYVSHLPDVGNPRMHGGGAGLGAVVLWTLVMAAFTFYPRLLEGRLVQRGRAGLSLYIGGHLVLAVWILWLTHIGVIATFVLYIVVSEAIVLNRRLGWIVGVAAAVAVYGEMFLLEGWSHPENYLQLSTWFAGLIFIAGTTVLLLREQDARARSEELLVELKAAHGQLRAYADRVQDLAAAQERTRLARELHDSVTQALFSMTLHARAAQMAAQRAGIEPDGTLARSVLQLGELTRGALAEMRALIFDLRPGALEEEGLVAALRKQAAALSAREGLEVEVEAPAVLFTLDPTTEEHLYRLAQEALHNVIKHARARHVRVRLDRAAEPAGTLVLEIGDDGVGFDPATVPPGHMGLGTMAERARQIGGRVDVVSRPGKGTTVWAVAPGVLREASSDDDVDGRVTTGQEVAS